MVTTIDTMVDDHYPFADYKGIELDEFSGALWATLDNDTSDADFLADINYALSMLRDGHTRMERRALKEPAVAPVDVEIDEEGVRIVAVDDEELADLVGERIDSVDGVDVHQAVTSIGEWTEAGHRGEFSLRGAELAFAGEAGTTVELALESGQTVKLQRRALHDEPEVRHLDDGIGYLRLDTFGFIDDLDRVDRAMNELMDSEGLMIDLRNNGGGFPSVSDGLFGRLIAEDVPSFGLVDVDGFESRKLTAKPRGETYRGEVVVLTNGRTYSASNYFAHRMLYHERGILIGGPTGGGAAAPKMGVRLLPGVWFQVSSHVVRTPEGDHSESGFEPQINVDDEEDMAIEEGGLHTLTVTGDPVMNRAHYYLTNGE